MTHHLLFVDDIPEDAELACWELSRAGIHCEYRVVDSAQSLTAALSERLPDLILSDIVLPDFDSWYALRICRATAPAVPFVLYSGVVSVADARLGKERGVFATAEKDVPGDLLKVVRRALGV